DIEEAETFEAVIDIIDKGLEPYKADFYREITRDDIIQLTEIRIKRISKYDSFRADELMRKWEEELAATEDNLANITRYAIDFFKDLLKKYGKGKERRTEIRVFNQIAANIVAANNQKLYVNRADGFIGYGLKKDEYVMDCSDLDDIIVFRRDGVCLVTRRQDKVFVGKDIIHCEVYVRNNERKVYNLAYTDGKTGVTYVKRFQITAVTRDREYVLTQGTPKSKIIYFSSNDNGEAETINVSLTAQSKAKIKNFDFDFSRISIKNRSAMGNILTKYAVRKIVFKSAGVSTLGGVDIWFDNVIGRLNRDERGRFLGNFGPTDQILVIYKDGTYELTNFDLTNHYEPSLVVTIGKFAPDLLVTALDCDGAQITHYIKRFMIETSTADKKSLFSSDARGSKLVLASLDTRPRLQLTLQKAPREPMVTEEYLAEDMVEVRGWRALGNKIAAVKLKEGIWLEPLPEEEKNETQEPPPVEGDEEPDQG